MRFRYVVDDPSGPERVDRFLSETPGLPSRSFLKRLFEEGLIMVNGVPAKPSTRIRQGDTVTGELPEARPTELNPEPIPLEIIYQDKELAVVDKPAGLLTHPTPSRVTGTMVNALLHHLDNLSGIGGWIKPGIVHRLDMMTSGVLVVAKNDSAHQNLSEQFKRHSIDRRYLALIFGEMKNLSGTLESAIGRNPKYRLKMTGEAKKGRHAVTHYRTLSRKFGFSLVELRLETGRTHQIRVHLSENGHPVVGDALYGKGRNPPFTLDSHQRSALQQLKRQALHAYYLGFEHPVTSLHMAFASPPPEDMAAAISALGLEHGLDIPERPGRVI